MSTPRPPSVLWREGMFLCPQHMQAFGRELAARIAFGDAIGVPGTFGLASLAIDADALARDVFRITAAEAVMRDGTWLSIPHNGHAAQREFGEFFTGPELAVYLGIAAVQSNVPQIGEEKDRQYRYVVDVKPTFDENARDASRELEFRTLRVQLFFGDEDRSGFESLPIARLVRTGKPATVSAMSPTWIAPVLRCGAVPAMVRALDDVLGRARAQARDLAATLPDTTRLSSVDSAADMSGIFKLQSVNRSVAALEQVQQAADLHPFHAYLELTRIVGDLAIFGATRVSPNLPIYDHARLDECFAAVLTQVRELLGAQVAVPYDVAPFEPDAEQEGIYYAAIPPEWFNAQPVFHLGVQLDQTPERAAELVAAGVKLLGPEDLQHVLQGVVPGVALEPVRIPPTSFPKRAGLHYFRIATEGPSRDFWLRVVQARKAMVLSALGGLGQVGFGLYVELRG